VGPEAHPLLIAIIQNSDLEMIKLLLDYGADPNRDNLLEFCVSYEDFSLEQLKLLLDHQ
jgi:hypothetical protein